MNSGNPGIEEEPRAYSFQRELEQWPFCAQANELLSVG